MRLLIGVAALALVGCSASSETAPSETPSYVPAPAIPETNPSSVEGFELGRHLFYDPRLSGNGKQACADCHRQELAFADDQALSIGSTGVRGHLNAPSLVNAAYLMPLGWASPDLDSIEEQLKGPMFGTSPVEMGIAGHEEEVLAALRADDRYAALFAAAFPESPEALTLDHARLALATFVRGIVSFRAPFDSYLQGELGAISPEAERGAALFFSPRLGCSHCHAGFNFTGASHSGESAGPVLMPYHNVGLYDLDGEGSYPDPAQGLIESSGRSSDMGRFRAPSLRNLAFTGPYMHDGSIDTLEEVIELYDDGNGGSSEHRSADIPSFQLSESERDDLVAFLLSLSDEAVTEDPRFANPWSESPSTTP